MAGRLLYPGTMTRPPWRWRAILFPDLPRRVPHARVASVACRTAHLVAFGLLLGGHTWAVDADRLVPVLWLTVGSGFALMALETFASAGWLLEVRGLMVLVKLGLLLLVPYAWDHRVPLLMAVVIVASVGSHMPRRFRHVPVISFPKAAAHRGVLENLAISGHRTPLVCGPLDRSAHP